MLADQEAVDAAAAAEPNAVAAPTPAETHKLVPQSAPSNVKRVVKEVNLPSQKAEAPKAGKAGKGTPQPDDRLQRYS